MTSKRCCFAAAKHGAGCLFPQLARLALIPRYGKSILRAIDQGKGGARHTGGASEPPVNNMGRSTQSGPRRPGCPAIEGWTIRSSPWSSSQLKGQGITRPLKRRFWHWHGSEVHNSARTRSTALRPPVRAGPRKSSPLCSIHPVAHPTSASQPDSVGIRPAVDPSSSGVRRLVHVHPSHSSQRGCEPREAPRPSYNDGWHVVNPGE